MLSQGEGAPGEEPGLPQWHLSLHTRGAATGAFARGRKLFRVRNGLKILLG